jgi:general secretion pathway protein G
LKADNIAAVMSARISATERKADISAAMTQIGMLRHCLDQYASECKSYPSTKQGLGALMNKPASLDDSVNWDGPYISMDTLPKDPWGNEYKYELVDDSTPHIWSMGPDGQDGTDDDITSWNKDDSSTTGTARSTRSGGSTVKPGGSPSRSRSTPSP